jgi:Na+/melibiose symporter-like transporter
MTGIYECYCKTYVTLGEAMSTSNLCFDYYFKYVGGGSKITTLLGMSLGITNYILALIVRKISKKIDFHSVKTQSAFVFCLTFGIFFMNSSLLSAVLLPQ